MNQCIVVRAREPRAKHFPIWAQSISVALNIRHVFKKASTRGTIPLPFARAPQARVLEMFALYIINRISNECIYINIIITIYKPTMQATFLVFVHTSVFVSF